MLKRFRQREFSEWLNPILFKELKQAVRSKQFVTIFVIIQVVMVWVTLAMGKAANSRDLQEMVGVFWTVLGFYLLAVLPFSGITALSREYRDSRIDLLRITNIGARGIVIGKWLSINIQGWLVILSLAPYIALRYFIGSLNPMYELGMLGLFLYGSLVASCLTVSCSAAHTIFGRLFFFFTGGFMLMILTVVAATAATAATATTIKFIIIIPVILAFQAFVLWTFLEAARGLITQKRGEYVGMFEGMFEKGI